MIKSKALSLTLSAAMIVSVAGLAGCGNSKDTNTTRTHNISTKNNGRIGGNMLHNYSNNNGTQHDLSNVKYSKTLSEKISKIKGVRGAHVFVTDNNAYVSLSLHSQSKNHVTNPNTTSNMRSMSTDKLDGTSYGMNGSTTGADGMTGRNDGLYGNSGTGSVGLMRGMTDGIRSNNMDGTGTGTGRLGVRGYSNGGFGGSGYNTMGDGTNGTGLMGTNGIRKMGGTDGRYGMMSNNSMGSRNTSYENSVPKHIRTEISNKIHKSVPNVKEVYVSSDAGFYEHSTRYSGKNINGKGNNNNGNGYTDGDGNVVTNTVGDISHGLSSWVNRIFPLNMGEHDGVRTNNTNYRNNNNNQNNNGIFNNNGKRDGILDMYNR